MTKYLLLVAGNTRYHIVRGLYQLVKIMLIQNINIKAEKLVKNKISSLEMKYDNKKFALERQYENNNSRMISQHKKRMTELEAKYQTMVAGYRGMVYFTLFYSILTTMITAWKTEVFAKDVAAFIMEIKDGVIAIVEWISVAASFVAQLGDMIPQEVVATIVHWVLVIGVYGMIIGAIGWAVFVLSKKYIRFFKDKQADEISVFVGLIILAMVVFASDLIKSILSINLVSLMIVVFVGYKVVRGIVQAENVEVKKNIIKWAVIAIVGVGVITAVFHFFGGIGLIGVIGGGLWAMSEK